MAAEFVGAVSERGLFDALFSHRARPADAVASVMEESLPMLGITEPVADAVDLLRSLTRYWSSTTASPLAY